MDMHATTILAVRHKGEAAVGGDGQVTLNNTIIKHHAKKVRKIYQGKIIVGFAGATADALNLSERLEQSSSATMGISPVRRSNWPGIGEPTNT